MSGSDLPMVSEVESDLGSLGPDACGDSDCDDWSNSSSMYATELGPLLDWSIAAYGHLFS